jgi:hypothetical protein
MNRFTIVMAAAALAASLTGLSQPSYAFRLHLPHMHVPHPSAPSGPFANAAGGPLYPYGR